MRMSPLESALDNTGCNYPRGSYDLPALLGSFDALPKCFTYGVEVRHPDFFAKGEAEQLFNRGLQAWSKPGDSR